MQLSDLLSNAQINAMRSAATAPEPHTKYAPSLDSKTANRFIGLAALFGCAPSRVYWASIENAVASRGRWLAHYTKGDMEIVDLDFLLGRNASNCLWRMGEWLKAGHGMVLIANGGITQIDWRNWKRIYAGLSEHVDTNVYDPEVSRGEKIAIRTNRKREKMFDDARAVTTRKKGGKGRSMSFDEHRAVYRRVERESRDAQIVYNAQAIMREI